MSISDFFSSMTKLKLQSPSVLYVKDRLCKRCGVFESVSVCKCGILGKKEKGRLDSWTSMKFFSPPQPLSAGSILNKTRYFSASSST